MSKVALLDAFNAACGDTSNGFFYKKVIKAAGGYVSTQPGAVEAAMAVYSKL